MHRRRDPATVRRPGVGHGSMRSEIGIVGAGPAGRLASRLLHPNGIESVVLKARSRDYVESRVSLSG